MPRPRKGEKTPGSGKPKGYKAPQTMAKLEAREYVRQRVTAELGPMLDKQIAHAKGIDHFFLRDPRTKQFKLIEDPKMIEAALNMGNRDDYYWVFTKDPSVQAFTDLLNRALDKPTDSVDVSVKKAPIDMDDDELEAYLLGLSARKKPKP